MPGDMAMNPFHRIGGAERQTAGEHLIERDAERIEVAAGIDRAVHPPGLLGRHIGERAGDELGRPGRLTLARQMRRDPGWPGAGAPRRAERTAQSRGLRRRFRAIRGRRRVRHPPTRFGSRPLPELLTESKASIARSAGKLSVRAQSSQHKSAITSLPRIVPWPTPHGHVICRCRSNCPSALDPASFERRRCRRCVRSHLRYFTIRAHLRRQRGQFRFDDGDPYLSRSIRSSNPGSQPCAPPQSRRRS